MVKLFEYVKKLSGIYLIFLTFLLPLKFSGIAIMPETSSYFPAEYWEYILVNFPNNSLGIFSGIGLILAIIAYGSSLRGGFNIIFLLSLAIFSIFGVFNASTQDYVYLSLAHIWGVISYILSIYLWIKDDKDNLNRFYNVITISAALTLLVGLYQYFIGFDEQIEFYKSQAKGNFEVDLSNKLMERRIYSTFGGCNVYAGYLLLILGIALYRIKEFSELFHPQKTSRIIFFVIFGITYLFVIANTGSRAVILGVFFGILLMVFLSKISKKIKIALALSLGFLSVAGILASQFFGRNFASFTERFGYIKSSLIMMYNHFFLGSGWGDFLVDNQKYRFIISNEAARDPHNIFLTFGSQAGIFAMLAIIALFLVPLIKFIIRYRKDFDLKNGIIIFSAVAFLIHAMLDVDYQIPGLFALAGGIFVTLNIDDEKDLFTNRYLKCFILFLMALIGFLSFKLSLYNTVSEKKYDDFVNSINSNSIVFDIEKKYNEIDKLKPYSPFHKIKMYQYLKYYHRNINIGVFNMKVLPYLLKAIEKSPERAGYYRYLSDYYFEINDKVNGEKYLQKSIELAPYTAKIKL